jgi:hypothetical protein
VLLLQDLLKHTATEHHDFKNLEAALAIMKEMAGHLNKMKSEADSRSRLVELSEKQIKGYSGNYLRKAFSKTSYRGKSSRRKLK